MSGVTAYYLFNFANVMYSTDQTYKTKFKKILLMLNSVIV
jgi:hypothetical protein